MIQGLRNQGKELLRQLERVLIEDGEMSRHEKKFQAMILITTNA